jgi:hypothetical protein
MWREPCVLYVEGGVLYLNPHAVLGYLLLCIKITNSSDFVEVWLTFYTFAQGE